MSYPMSKTYEQPSVQTYKEASLQTCLVSAEQETALEPRSEIERVKDLVKQKTFIGVNTDFRARFTPSHVNLRDLLKNREQTSPLLKLELITVTPPPPPDPEIFWFQLRASMTSPVSCFRRGLSDSKWSTILKLIALAGLALAVSYVIYRNYTPTPLAK